MNCSITLHNMMSNDGELPTIELTTPRLRLRQWQASDYRPFAELNANTDVMAHFPAPLTAAESRQIADKCHQLIASRGWGFWAVELKTTGEFIGFVGLHTPSDALPFSPCVEIGWRLARPYWRQGFATEAAEEALRFAFTVLGLPRVVAFTPIDNHRSRAVMLRLGMRNTEENFLHPDIAADSPHAEHVLFAIEQQQWKRQHARVQLG
ncbi:GNAT family N-acetyltransferase [Gilvimarinus algae]|uniref:GNAT family N-acetyltransferase n=1 Tax=Gilvimarinus algae TaxID=3058037 RepID=A0ABT8TI42_9GAMM|nr:GNAT family N-acetyltransferase [Gilvimarinus sp. SDUM040014]MDO3383700.1 GNAT family N-acetyltransferase [Gilvimarinus sp. SDUM040014]